MACLDTDSYFVLLTTIVALLLMCNDLPPDLVLLGATVLLQLTSVISSADAWKGFSSSPILALAGLFVLARALEETRAVELVIRPLLGRPRYHAAALIRLCVPAAVASAFLNNTPIVMMLIPVVESWAARCELSPRVLLMPLSFASMMGGMCTLIGTSTNMARRSSRSPCSTHSLAKE